MLGFLFPHILWSLLYSLGLRDDNKMSLFLNLERVIDENYGVGLLLTLELIKLGESFFFFYVCVQQ
jgi:hypothetical protein